MSINRLLLQESAESLFGLSLDEDCIDTLEAYYDAVVEANKEFNLTSITGKDEFVVKHLIDSLAGVSFIPEGATLIDVGSGGGFPSFPIASARRDVQVTALDSTAKKMNFVGGTARFLGVKNLKTISGRAEEMKDLFERFDTVTARAVSALPILLEICSPLIKVGGIMIAYKTDESELEVSKNALKTLNMTHKKSFSFNLPNGDRRCILVFEKTSPTPKQYPRQYGQIKKRPL
ncbi:MAG: 16S rRNA (guanine(527)-N(7))-methyltransferase RsmG [Clostridia bacterium]|nr:16S rRNA (guanine(527)-N(7))-methyltransferase RsmG [Clostridia bacterium]